jgi:thioesterase domain-containing protein
MTGISEQRAWPSNAANFLKHADRDVDKLLMLDDVNNEHLLMGSAISYLQLMQTATPEMVAYLAYWSVKNEAEYDLSAEGRQLADRLKIADPNNRLALSLAFIRDAKDE